MKKVQRAANICIIIAISVVFIIYAKNFLIPLILAIVLWYLINALNQLIRRVPFVIEKVPLAVTLIISTLLTLLLLFSIGSLIMQNVNGLIASAPEYRVNFEAQINRIASSLGFAGSYDEQSLSEEFNLGDYLRRLLNSLQLVASQFLLILLYTLFMLLEQSTFPRKILSLGMEKKKKESVFNILDRVNQAVRTYIGVKFVASFATGLLSYAVIRIAGLDFALFWAFLIFTFNFIPTIGSIGATLFPSFVALVQFETLSPFLIIIIGVGVIQLIIGGIMEPRLYGNSLNISPLVIVISLVMWGILWGVVGMLLCVPITVILIQIFAQFPSTRPVAVLLSRNGRIHTFHNKDK